MTPENLRECAWDLPVRATPFGTAAMRTVVPFFFQEHDDYWGESERALTHELRQFWDQTPPSRASGDEILSRVPLPAGHAHAHYCGCIDQVVAVVADGPLDPLRKHNAGTPINRDDLNLVSNLVVLAFLAVTELHTDPQTAGMAATFAAADVAKIGGFPICLRSEFRLLATLRDHVSAVRDAEGDEALERTLRKYVAARIKVAVRHTIGR